MESLWREPDFLKLWLGQTISQIGSSVSTLGIPFTALYVLNASPLQMSLLTGAGGASILIFGIFAGAWADRLQRRPILIAADLGRAALLATVPLAASLHRLTMGHLYALAVAAGILTVFFDASYQAYMPSLAGPDRLLEGNAKLALSSSAAEVTGPALTGMLVQWLTAPVAILGDAGSFLISALSLCLIAKREALPQPTEDPHLLREIAEGLRACWREPILRTLALRTAIAAFCLGPIGGLYMILATRELHIGALLLGLIVSIGGGSSLLGTLAAGRLTRRFGLGPVLTGGARRSPLTPPRREPRPCHHRFRLP